MARAQLLERMLLAQPVRNHDEQAQLLANLQSIEQQVQVLVSRIDAVQSVTYIDKV